MADDPKKKAVDRRFVSQQQHEQAYQKRRAKKNGKAEKAVKSKTSK